MNQRNSFFTGRFRVLLPPAALLWNQLVYWGGAALAENKHHLDLSTPIDTAIPLLAWTVSIYFGCYAFWALHYCLCAKEPWRAKPFFKADFWAKGICFFFFVFLPTTMARPAVQGLNLWESLVRALYLVDAPVNLFPSIHCLNSWLCWASARDDPMFSRGYKAFALVMAVAVCASTLTTRQHVLADILGGILLAEACWQLARKKA